MAISETRRQEEFEQLLATTNTDADATARMVEDHADTIFTRDDAKGRRPRLETLHEKYEDRATTDDEYGAFDGVERDRAAG